MQLIRTYLYKKRHKSGAVTWVVRWKDLQTGLWRSLSGGKTKQEAMVVEARIRETLLRGEDPTPKQDEHAALRLSELIELYYQGARFLSGSEHWQRVLRSRMEKVIRPALGEAHLATLKKERILKFYLELKSKGLSHKTIKQYHLCVSVLGQFYEDITGKPNPVREIRNFNKLFPKQAPTRDINFLTEEELRRLFEACSKSSSRRLQFVVRVLAGTGMRRSEALQIKWRDIDLSGGFIHVRQSKNGEARVIPLEKDVRDVFNLLPRYGELVFALNDGTPYDKDSLLQPLKSAAKKAKIAKRVDLHTLRHSYGSNKIRQGWGLKKVSMILGHSDISITAKVYTHLLDGDLKVRDEFRVEEKAAERTEDRVASAVQELVRVLKTTPTSTLNEDSVADAIKLAVLREMQSAAASRTDLQRMGAQGAPAPQLLRGTNSDTLKHKSDSGSLPEIASDSNVLPSDLNGGPARARTWDLQIRSLTL